MQNERPAILNRRSFDDARNLTAFTQEPGKINGSRAGNK